MALRLGLIGFGSIGRGVVRLLTPEDGIEVVGALVRKTGRTADSLSCSFSVPANASPAARCAAIRRQCGGKFYANYCGDKLLSAM